MRRGFSAHDREVAAAVHPVLDAVARQWISSRGRVDPDRAASIGLTNRELAVLRLLCEGSPPASIARRLMISPRTTHKHLENVYRKLDVHDRHDAVTSARTLGIISARPAR
jgi:DNA-binding CsgD family transcriptional regulator